MVRAPDRQAIVGCSERKRNRKKQTDRLEKLTDTRILHHKRYRERQTEKRKRKDTLD